MIDLMCIIILVMSKGSDTFYKIYIVYTYIIFVYTPYVNTYTHFY